MFGIITKKNLLEVAMRIERNENTANAKDPQDLFYRMGEYNALNEVCRAFGVDLTSAIKEAHKRHA